MTTAASQCKSIADYLRSGKRLTALDALRLWGISRAAARVHELITREGMNIHKEMVPVIGRNGVARVAEYYLPKPRAGEGA